MAAKYNLTKPQNIILRNFSLYSKKGMKVVVRANFICLFFFSLFTHRGFGQFVQLNCNDFTLNSSTFKPLVVNYSISFVADDYGTYFISPNQAGSVCWGPNGNVFGYGSGNANYFKSIAKLNGDLTRIKNAGFNTIRLIGAGSIVNGTNLDIPVPASAGGYTTYYSLLTQFFSKANAVGLKVILLTAGADQCNVNDQYKTYLENFANYFKNNTTILAYDLYNEPENILKAQKLKFNKYDFAELISGWSYAIKRNDPNHLVTIGLYAPDFTAFDPALLPIDFVSFHFYAQNDNVNTTINKMKIWYYWCSKTITIPWIIGETGYSASDPFAAAYSLVGTEADQKKFVDSTLQKSFDCNCKAYSYWHFQEYGWGDPYEDHLGLYYRFGNNPPSGQWWGWGASTGDPLAYTLDSLAMTPKPALSSFSIYPYLIKGSCGQPSNYYTFLNGTSTTNSLHGWVKDNLGNAIPNACIQGVEGWNDGSAYTTFSDSNGEFWVKSGGNSGSEALTTIRISYPGYSEVLYSNEGAPWMSYPSGNIFIMQKVNYKGWTKEYQSSSPEKLNTDDPDRDWVLSGCDKFYKGDFNGDGKQDLLCIEVLAPGEHIANDQLLRMAVLTYQNPMTTNPYSAGWKILWDINTDPNSGGGLYDYRDGKLTIGDFNGDGTDDILAQSSWLTYFTFNGSGWVWQDSNYGQTSQSGNSMSYMTTYSNYFVAGDFDGNGRDGVIGVTPGSSPLITWFRRNNSGVWQALQSNNGLTNNSAYPLSYLTPYSEQLLAGDFDGDSKDELLGNKLSSGGFQLFKYNTSGASWWNSSYWKDLTNNSGMWAYRQNLVIGNFDFDGSDEILGINSYYCVKFKFSGTSGLYWDSSYEPLISDWNISPNANKYLFLKTEKNLPQQLFANRGNTANLYSWNMNAWQCATMRYADNADHTIEDYLPVLNDAMNVFPTPSHEDVFVHIETRNDILSPSIQLINMLGDVVLTEKIEPIKAGSVDEKISLSGLAPGLYFINLLDQEKRTMTGKVLVE